MAAARAFGITRKTALDSKQYWVNRASTAARNEKEKGIALQYENEDSLTKRSEGLLTVLGVEPEALVEMASREPGILLMSDTELAVRLMALKAAAPRLNIQELVRRRPQILRGKHGVRAVERAVRDLEALMPALPVQDRILDRDGQMWQSFRERLLYWENQSLNDESLNL
ncbi:hypothetical protein WJX75_007504 [Coccomyxa subellipsoidea]|uniref:Uncharacterized protein n=2 Tax=Coccomyxa subellipsoidea TaxID=248742 RepID=A0ABR2Z0T3_9CHLO